MPTLTPDSKQSPSPSATDRHETLRDLVAARVAAEEALRSAVRANLENSRFLAAASHDLRQPLQALALLNATLRRTVRDPVASEAVVQQSLAIGSMSQLVNALLDFCKLESGAIRPVRRDIRQPPAASSGCKSDAELEHRLRPERHGEVPSGH